MKTTQRVLLSTILLLFLASANAQQDSLHYYLQKARKALTENDIETYYNNAQKSFEINSYCISSLYHYTTACVLNNKHQEAIQLIERMLKNGVPKQFFVGNPYDTLKNIDKYNLLLQEYANAKVISNSKFEFEVPEKDLIPEGITYDPNSKSFFLGSLTKSKIVQVDQNKNVIDFIKQGEHGFLPVLGMNVDKVNNILWANSCYGYKNEGIPDDKMGMAGIYKINLENGEVLKHYTLIQDENHFLNDVTIDNNGKVYMTDSHVEAIYTVNEKDELEKVSDLPKGSYPNGISISDDDNTLFIATTYAIYAYNLKQKVLEEIEFPGELVYSACDGLYFYKNSLIGVQSFLNKVTRLYLDENKTTIVKQEIIEAHNPLFENITTGVIVDDQFFMMANPQLSKINNDGILAPMDELNTVKVISVKLEN